MKLTRTFYLAVAITALFAVACGGGEDSAELPTADDLGAATCLADDPDCQDLGPLPTDDEPLFTDGEPTDGEDGDAIVQPLVGGGVEISEALTSDIDGGFAIVGFYLDDGSGARLCEALAESFPPQCGGVSIPVDNSAGVELDELQTEGSVTWTNQPAVLVGEIVDGVFVVTPISG